MLSGLCLGLQKDILDELAHIFPDANVKTHSNLSTAVGCTLKIVYYASANVLKLLRVAGKHAILKIVVY